MDSSFIKKLLTVLVIVNVLIIDFTLAYILMVKNANIGNISIGKLAPMPTTVLNVNNQETVDSCGPDCRSYIDNRIKIATMSSSFLGLPTPTTAVLAQNPTKTKTKSVTYLPIPGSGSVNETSWTDISGTEFYLAKVDYPGLTGAYLEVNLRLFNGNGLAYVRLYDVTNSRAVDGSEVSTNSQSSTVVTSGALSLWEGNNLYRIQAKSLTADTTVFESARLKLITEN